MSAALTGAEREAFLYLYGGGEEEIECQSMVWICIRYPQQCLSIMHRSKLTTFPAGTRMVLERAKVDGKFGSCYTCEACIKAVAQDLGS